MQGTTTLMLAAFCCLLFTVSRAALPAEECDIPTANRTRCGDAVMTRKGCENGNCCFDRGQCYNAKTVKSSFLPSYPGRKVSFGGMSIQRPDVPKKPANDAAAGLFSGDMVNMMTIMQMKKDGVDKSIINALLADSIPNGEMFYYMADGKISMEEMMQMQPMPDMEVDGMMATVLAGGDIKEALYGQIAGSYGMDPLIIKLLMAGEKDVVKEHMMSQMALPDDPMSKLIMRSLLSGEKLGKSSIMDMMIDSMIGSNLDIFTQTAFKAMLNKDMKTATKFLLLGQMQGLNFKTSYPKNEAIFARFVDLQKNHPGKISPEMIFSLAMNEKIPALAPGKTFSELFGVSAFDYVCAVHSPDLQTECKALAGTGGSSLDCFNVGCCLRANPAGGKPVCYENLLGNIGVGMASALWDEKYIVDNIFGGELPTLEKFYPDGIPWIVTTTLPASATVDQRIDPAQKNWWDSLAPLGIARVPNPQAKALIKPDAFNPNFEWAPHGATPFPFATNAPDLPAGVPAVTSEPGKFGGSLPAPAAPGAAPIVKALALDTFPGCFTVAPEDKVACMGNDVAWLAGGEAKCAAIGCCFNKDISNPAVPACFSSANRGQCHNVADSEKIDCGFAGITSDECLSNPQCCYDSSTSSNSGGAPWCYYKKYSFLPTAARCSSVGHAARVGCWPKKGFMDLSNRANKDSCLKAGCCYEEVKGGSFLNQLLTGFKAPPRCFKPGAAPIKSLDPAPPAPPAPITTAKCQFKDTMDPAARVDCGASSWHECVRIKECCYEIVTILDGVPFCFKKSDIPV